MFLFKSVFIFNAFCLFPQFSALISGPRIMTKCPADNAPQGVINAFKARQDAK